MTIQTNNLTVLKQQFAKYLTKHNRNTSSAKLIGASKTRDAEIIRAYFNAGLKDFGENYLDEALSKQSQLIDLGITWHYIGSIQSNKTKSIAENFHWVHTIEREKIARRLNQHIADTKLSDKKQSALNVLIQINIDEEASKSGVLIQDAEKLASTILECPNLTLRGLMSIPKQRKSYADQVAIHERLITLKNSLENSLNISMDTISAGMSNDAEAAIQAGSTMIRIGTDLFGKRDDT